MRRRTFYSWAGGADAHLHDELPESVVRPSVPRAEVDLVQGLDISLQAQITVRLQEEGVWLARSSISVDKYF